MTHRRFRVPLLAAAALAVVAGAAVVIQSHHPAPTAAAPAAAPPNPADSFHSDLTYEEVAAPVRIRIPAMHVDSKLIHLGLRPDGSVAVPPRTDVAGWYDGGPRPGQPGPAVILGHVDSKTGPAVFARLKELRPGDKVSVTMGNGSVVRYAVRKVVTYPNAQFPARKVYAATGPSTLNLVTCGGSYDKSNGGYQSNVVVYTSLAVPTNK